VPQLPSAQTPGPDCEPRADDANDPAITTIDSATNLNRLLMIFSFCPVAPMCRAATTARLHLLADHPTL